MSFDPPGDDRAVRIATLAAAMRDSFGDRAIDVANRQRALAENDAETTWTAIIGTLERGISPGTPDL